MDEFVAFVGATTQAPPPVAGADPTVPTTSVVGAGRGQQGKAGPPPQRADAGSRKPLVVSRKPQPPPPLSGGVATKKPSTNGTDPLLHPANGESGLFAPSPALASRGQAAKSSGAAWHVTASTSLGVMPRLAIGDGATPSADDSMTTASAAVGVGHGGGGRGGGSDALESHRREGGGNNPLAGAAGDFMLEGPISTQQRRKATDTKYQRVEKLTLPPSLIFSMLASQRTSKASKRRDDLRVGLGLATTALGSSPMFAGFEATGGRRRSSVSSTLHEEPTLRTARSNQPQANVQKFVSKRVDEIEPVFQRMNHTLITYPRTGSIYAFGGRTVTGPGDPGQYTSAIHVFVASRGQWAEVPQRGKVCPSKRGDHTAVCYGQTMIVFGGRKHVVVLGDMWLFDIETGEWSEIQHEAAFGPGPVFGHAACVSPATHTMYIAGGTHHDDHGDRVVFAYNLKFHHWRAVRAPPEFLAPTLSAVVASALAVASGPVAGTPAASMLASSQQASSVAAAASSGGLVASPSRDGGIGDAPGGTATMSSPTSYALHPAMSTAAFGAAVSSVANLTTTVTVGGQDAIARNCVRRVALTVVQGYVYVFGLVRSITDLYAFDERTSVWVKIEYAAAPLVRPQPSLSFAPPIVVNQPNSLLWCFWVVAPPDKVEKASTSSASNGAAATTLAPSPSGSASGGLGASSSTSTSTHWVANKAAMRDPNYLFRTTDSPWPTLMFWCFDFATRVWSVLPIEPMILAQASHWVSHAFGGRVVATARDVNAYETKYALTVLHNEVLLTGGCNDQQVTLRIMPSQKAVNVFAAASAGGRRSSEVPGSGADDMDSDAGNSGGAASESADDTASEAASVHGAGSVHKAGRHMSRVFASMKRSPSGANTEFVGGGAASSAPEDFATTASRRKSSRRAGEGTNSQGDLVPSGSRAMPISKADNRRSSVAFVTPTGGTLTGLTLPYHPEHSTKDCFAFTDPAGCPVVHLTTPASILGWLQSNYDKERALLLSSYKQVLAQEKIATAAAAKAAARTKQGGAGHGGASKATSGIFATTLAAKARLKAQNRQVLTDDAILQRVEHDDRRRRRSRHDGDDGDDEDRDDRTASTTDGDQSSTTTTTGGAAGTTTADSIHAGGPVTVDPSQTATRLGTTGPGTQVGGGTLLARPTAAARPHTTPLQQQPRVQLGVPLFSVAQISMGAQQRRNLKLRAVVLWEVARRAVLSGRLHASGLASAAVESRMIDVAAEANYASLPIADGGAVPVPSPMAVKALPKEWRPLDMTHASSSQAGPALAPKPPTRPVGLCRPLGSFGASTGVLRGYATTAVEVLAAGGDAVAGIVFAPPTAIDGGGGGGNVPPSSSRTGGRGGGALYQPMSLSDQGMGISTQVPLPAAFAPASGSGIRSSRASSLPASMHPSNTLNADAKKWRALGVAPPPDAASRSLAGSAHQATVATIGSVALPSSLAPPLRVLKAVASAGGGSSTQRTNPAEGNTASAALESDAVLRGDAVLSVRCVAPVTAHAAVYMV